LKFKFINLLSWLNYVASLGEIKTKDSMMMMMMMMIVVVVVVVVVVMNCSFVRIFSCFNVCELTV
jgi:Tfp pilus assembly protein PilN